MKVGDIVKETKFKKIVVKAVDKETGEVLYEHIGIGEGGFEWPLGVLVVEKKKKQNG